MSWNLTSLKIIIDFNKLKLLFSEVYNSVSLFFLLLVPSSPIPKLHISRLSLGIQWLRVSHIRVTALMVFARLKEWGEQGVASATHIFWFHATKYDTKHSHKPLQFHFFFTYYNLFLKVPDDQMCKDWCHSNDVQCHAIYSLPVL